MILKSANSVTENSNNSSLKEAPDSSSWEVTHGLITQALIDPRGGLPRLPKLCSLISKRSTNFLKELKELIFIYKYG